MAAVSLAEIDRRVALTRGSGRLDVQEQFDWGETALASGDRTSARLLIEAGAIQQGFSPQLERARAVLFDTLGLARAHAGRDVAQGNTVDIALDELRFFARTYGRHVEACAADGVRRAIGKPGLHPTASLARGTSLPSDRSVADLVHDMFLWMRDPASEQGDTIGVAAIDALRGAETDPLRWSAAGLAGATLPVLANAIAVQELRAFLRAHGDLLLPRLGSPALFRATASFHSAGLGPYFGNVGQIARNSANLFELAGIAADAADMPRGSAGEEAFLALLMRGVSGWLRFDIVDELGDRNATFALTIILERAVSVAADDVDRSLVARIRDAALDNLEFDLAGAAQGKLVEVSRGDWLERRILGAIQASGGHVAAANQVLSACLDDKPDDERLRQEVEANRERRYAPFALVKGYGSPQDRQLKRIQARATAA
jgi:hypothetical protein